MSIFRTKAHTPASKHAINTVNALLELSKPDFERNSYRHNFLEFRKLHRATEEVTLWDRTYEKLAEPTPFMVIELQEAVVISHIQRIEAILDVDIEYALERNRFGDTAISLAAKLGKDNIVNMIRLRLKKHLERKVYAS